jgi:hypothetical protein
MKHLKTFITLLALFAFAAISYAGNIHRDGEGVGMPDAFAPVKTRTLEHTKADVSYTPTAGTKRVRITPTGAVFAKLSSVTNKKDTTGYPIAANAEKELGIATRIGVGVKVDRIIFGGASSATKTIYIQEQ